MKILVAGDVIVDRYFFVSSERKAAEADMPVWDEEKVEYRLGGAANVALNLRKLLPQAEIDLVGLIGNCKQAVDLLKEYKINSSLCVGSSTMFKNRFVDSQGKYLLRHDNFKYFPGEDVKFLQGLLHCQMWDQNYDAVIFSDYDKGTLNPEIIKMCWKSKLILVDSKKVDLRMFSGAQVVKLNAQEFSIQQKNNDYLLESLFESVVVTRGKQGAELIIRENNFFQKNRGKWYPSFGKTGKEYYVNSTAKFPAESVPTVDVTGSGDTFCAALCIAMLEGKDLYDAIEFANKVASQVVQKFGTATP